jgi:hypothetical protein
MNNSPIVLINEGALRAVGKLPARLPLIMHLVLHDFFRSCDGFFSQVCAQAQPRPSARADRFRASQVVITDIKVQIEHQGRFLTERKELRGWLIETSFEHAYMVV